MKPLPWRVRAQLFLQLSRLEAAGLPYDRGIATMALPSPGAQRLKAMQQLAARGVDAAKAGERSGLFTKVEARLVRAGLDGGNAARVYQRLAEQASLRAMHWTTLKGRMMLPAFVLAVGLVVPPLPALISGAIGFAGYAWQVVWPLLVIAAVVLVLRALLAAWPRMPLYGPISMRTNLRDFFESLALMLEAGIPMLEALPAALDAVADGDIRRELARIRRRIDERATFAAALEGVPYLRGSPVLAMAHTGEASGTLPEMLMRYAAMETDAITQLYKRVAEWLPRVVYALVALKIIAGIAALGGLGPKVPADL